MNEQITTVLGKRQIVAIVTWLAIGIFCIMISLARNGQPVFNSAYEHYKGYPRNVFRTQEEDRNVYIKQYKQGDLSVFHIDYEGDSYVVTVYPVYTNDEERYELDFSSGQKLLYKEERENLALEGLDDTTEDERVEQIGITVVQLYLKKYERAGTLYPTVRWSIEFFIGFLIFMVQVFRKINNWEAEKDNLTLKKKRKVWCAIGIIIMVHHAMLLLVDVTSVNELPRFVSTLIWASHNGVK